MFSFPTSCLMCCLDCFVCICFIDGTRQEEVEGELSEEERWFGNSSETPSEASYGEVQENFKLSLEDRIQDQSTSPDTSLGSATPSSNTAELGTIENEALRDTLQSKEHLSPDASSLCEEEPPGSNKPLSSNLRRLLEAGSLKLDAAVTVNGRVESPVNLGSNLSFSPPAHHAQQLSVLARKLAEKQEQSDQYNAGSHFIWNQGKWLPNSTTTCSLSPDSAILKLKAAANAVLQDRSLSRTEDNVRFESFSSPFSSQSASSTLAALSKKVSERSMTPGQEHPPPASSFLSLASMTSSAALLKEVAARAAGTLLAEKKKSLVAEDPLQLSEMKQEKATPPQSLELLLLPVSKGRASKPTSTAANQKEPLTPKFKVKDEPKDEEAASSTLSQSSYVFSQESEASAPSVPKEKLKPQEAQANMMRQDISVKAASELLMKLSAESYKETQTVKIKEEPMEVDIHDSQTSVSPSQPSQNVGYSTLLGRDISEHIQKAPEGRMLPERNLFSQDISVKMASELLFQLSEKVSKEHNHNKDNTIRTTVSPYFSEDTFRQSPFTSNSKDLLPNETALHGRTSAPETEKLGLEAGNGLPSWKFNDQLFPCEVCGKVFGRQQTLSRHLSLHTEERKYKCHLCPYAAKCRANLNQHLTVHSVKLVSTDTEDIVSAVTSEGSDGKKHPYYYSCHVCGFETEMNVQFVSHMSLHVDKEQWMFSICCTACDFVTMEEADMKAHVNSKHTAEERKTPSESNSPSSSSLSALSDSANSKEDADVSPKNKGSNNLLVISVVPGTQTSLNTEEKSEKGFECVFCNFVCKTKNMFERHLQIHLITRMFECDVCHKFMKTPEQLLEHKKCHTVPTGGLKCPFCIYSTNRPAAMECHLKTHYKMEYKCRICQTVKANQLELEMHIREHRLGNHYKCDQCGYLSKTANKLIEHVRVHTGERPFHCDQCSYSCKRKDNLNLHKKLKHAPRQTFSCDECLFKTTHPFVFSRHVKKHQNGDCSEEEKKGQYSTSKEASPLLPVNSSRNLLSPLSVMSASQALQTVAMSAAQSSGAEPNLAVKALAINGTSLCFDKYWNSEFAHLIPLTMFFPKNHYSLTFHPPRPQTAPGGASSPKHSFLAYLGLTERAETV
ncbi:zinc finger protein 827 isoform X5 [Centrocercus urophasianus]|uniref:zinc finger protein 827 isoform X5 n=1 Tax=Centrocercus urophasianus TaxID=9002 RepID=UPI001C64E154|nr:zinc finger protein 827 isoform X5 [Centrocercus urophasianus]